MWEGACPRWRPLGRPFFLVEYISVPAVTAAMGSALTAGHFWKRAPKVTKRALAPPLGASPPHSGLNPWAAVMGHPWPRTANPASCRVTHGFKPAFGQRGLTGRLRSKAKAKAKAKARRPYSRPDPGSRTRSKMWEGACPDSGGSVMHVLADTMLSGASPLPHLDLHRSDRSCSAFDLLLICF